MVIRCKSAAAVVAFISLQLFNAPPARCETPSTEPSAQTDQTPATQPDPESIAKQQDIRRLLVLTNAGQIGAQMASQMIDQMRGKWARVPNQFWDDFKRDMDPGTLVDLVVPIYDRHFSHDEIKQMIAFYESPVGRKVTAESGAILQESMVVGSQWGAWLSEQIMNRLRDHGYTEA